MLSATRRWFSRNRTPLAIGVGVVGAGYVAVNYLVSKIKDDRERIGSERIAKENLRRRFEQNQEDCTFTVLALLPTATANILEAMNTERITLEIQQMRGGARSITASAPPSIADTSISMTDDDGRSFVSYQSDGAVGLHGGRVDVHPMSPVPMPGAAEGMSAQEGAATEGGVREGGVPTGAHVPHPASAPRRKTKRQLWDELAISSITRSFTLIYTLALLTLLTRIQLNLLGRRSYLSSVVSLATGPAQAPISLENHDDDNTDQAYGGDFGTNRRYLTFSWWLLNKGWMTIRDRVEAAVRRAFGHLSPRDTLTLAEFIRLATQVREEVEGRGSGAMGSQTSGGRWLECLLPPQDQEEYVLRESGILEESMPSTPISPYPTRPASPGAPSLRHLLDETADLIESVPFTHVLTLLLDAGFALLLEQRLAAGAFELSNDEDRGSNGAGSMVLVEQQRRVLLPKTLSVLTRQAHAIGNGVPNEYLQEMERVRELESFAAVVYSSNWENEIRAYSQGQEEGAAAAKRSQSMTDDSSSQRGGMAASSWSVVVPPSESQHLASGSMVVVDSQNSALSLESAWERATEKR